MASTITVSNSVNWAQAFAGWRGLGLGTASEPAISTANIILQTIIGPPFVWNWNRSSVSFLTTVGIQDYAASAATFGFIEKASYVLAATITNVSLTSNVATYTAANSFTAGDPVTTTGLTTTALNIANQTIVAASATQFTTAVTHGNIGSVVDSGTATSGDVSEISSVQNILGSGNEPGEPAMISPQIDDNAGNITFRLLPIPDHIYQVNVIFQKKIAALISATSGTWTPIPDQYSYIYQYGFLALMLAYANDPRWASFSQKFVAGLLGAAEGLEEEQRNIFQAAWLDMVTEQQSTSLKTNQGIQGRSV